jgi:hypothetical protein
MYEIHDMVSMQILAGYGEDGDNGSALGSAVYGFERR